MLLNTKIFCHFLIHLNTFLGSFSYFIFHLPMASIISIHILLLLCICSSGMLIINKVTNPPFINNNNLKNLLIRYKNLQSSTTTTSDSNFLEDFSTALFSSDVKRRNVIMPRICYFARISGTGVHRKLCLPYNDNKRS